MTAHTAITAQVDGDWIDWTGGECPIADDQHFSVTYRNGVTTVFGYCAGAYPAELWQHVGDEGDVVKYRVVQL